ncbi:uncharacterized protein L203_102210 [Cryptococcus depauperatus CBS 7841]|uniref:Endoplasmic reticulum protein n=1 Tax=Cryptococcus depauperatus CBS 7841 TaxID=1295531 RepID=A0AAJ8JRG5_9TREE
MWEQPLYAQLPGVLAVFPFLCRIAAFALFAPFGVGIGLDIVAYAIARTLHLSITPRRVPRSPPSHPSQILSESADADSDSSSEMANATAVTLVGATGLTGSHTLSSLLSSSHPFNVTVLTRRSLPQAASANSLTTRLYASLFDAPTDKEPIVERGGVYVSCLGTTRAKAGGTAEQEKLILVSANGSSPHSRLFYSRIKGLLEEYVKSLSFSQTVILKPGLLLGDRQESRPAEAATRWLVGGLKKWGAPVDSLAVETEDIGACIAYLSAHPPTESLLTLGNHEIIAYAKQFHTSHGQVVMSPD